MGLVRPNFGMLDAQFFLYQVVDYIGIANELKQALKIYAAPNGKGEPTLKAEEALAILLEKMDVLHGMFHGFDYSDYLTNAHQNLILTANHILGLKDGKKRFLDVMASITRAFSLCGTLDEAAPLRKEIAFFSAIRVAIIKHTTIDTKLMEEQKNSTLKQILDNAVIAEGVADIFKLAGLDKPNIALLSDEFLEDVRTMKSRNLAVELLEKLLRDEIRAKTRSNVVLEKKFGDRLLETLQRYNARAIETAQVIEELIQMAKDFKAALKRDEDLGLNPMKLPSTTLWPTTKVLCGSWVMKFSRRSLSRLPISCAAVLPLIGRCERASGPSYATWCAGHCESGSIRRTNRMMRLNWC